MSLKILRWNLLGVYELALNPMAAVLIRHSRGEDVDWRQRRLCKDQDSDWSGAVTDQGTPGDTRSWKRQERALR